MDRYFDKFPIIKYGNTQIIDITKRVAILESVSKNPFIFYPYEVSEEERAEQFSTRYYKDPYKSWVIYLTNKITDPYYEWYLKQDEFEEFLVNKYGSVELAVEKIVYYRHNYQEVEQISVSAFNALTDVLKMYWEPKYNEKGTIVSYSRKNKDWIVNTNRIVKYDVSNTSFTNNEICTVYFDVNNTGTGQVLNTTNTSIYIQHTSGVMLSNDTVTITGSSYIYGRESNVNTSFSNTTLIVENLRAEEEIYWSAITCIDVETEKNEFNKTIRVIDNRYVDDIVRNFEDLLEDR